MTSPRPARTWFALLLMVIATLGGCASIGGDPLARPAPPVQPAVAYLHHLRAGVARAREQMPQMIRSADVAARRVVRNRGRIFVGGSQPDFPVELLTGAGRLAMLRPVPERIDLIEKDDVILYAARGPLTGNDRLRIDRWRTERGAYVVAFASARQSDVRYFPPDALIDCGAESGVTLAGGKLVPSDSVLNLLNAWAWTGEFFSACTRLGATPVMHAGEDFPSSAARARWYAGSAFHPDLNVAPVGTGVVGMAYLDRIEQSLSAILDESPDALRFAGVWFRDATPVWSSAQIISRLHPDHFRDPRAPQPFERIADAGAPAPDVAQASLVLARRAAPHLAVAAAHMRRSKLVYTSVDRAGDDRAGHILYLDPHWPAEDACVRVAGYDVPILASGSVVQAAIYWAIVAEIYPPPPAE